jgi:two-component system sensor histidine kinase AgrC
LSEKININKIGKKGYSTKGKNRGNGIFLIENLIKNNKDIKTTNKIINNYFIQEINIKYKEC